MCWQGMPISLHLQQSLKIPADNADNPAISRAARSDVPPVGGRGGGGCASSSFPGFNIRIITLTPDIYKVVGTDSEECGC